MQLFDTHQRALQTLRLLVVAAQEVILNVSQRFAGCPCDLKKLLRLSFRDRATLHQLVQALLAMLDVMFEFGCTEAELLACPQ